MTLIDGGCDQQNKIEEKAKLPTQINLFFYNILFKDEKRYNFIFLWIQLSKVVSAMAENTYLCLNVMVDFSQHHSVRY